MIYDINKMIVSAVIGVLILLIGGIIVFLSLMNNQIPTIGIYITIIGILIVIVGPLSIEIFENIKRWIVNKLHIKEE